MCLLFTCLQAQGRPVRVLRALGRGLDGGEEGAGRRLLRLRGPHRPLRRRRQLLEQGHRASRNSQVTPGFPVATVLTGQTVPKL